VDAAVPLWVILAGSGAFGCAAFLAMRAADALYESVARPAGRRAPNALSGVMPVLGAAALGAFFAARGASLPILGELAVVVAALAAALWSDLTRGVVGNWFVLPAIALVLTLLATQGRLAPVAFSAGFVTLPFALAALFSKGAGFGWGDVKLVLLGAVLLDAQTSILLYAGTLLVAIAVTCILGKRKEPIVFAPYLAAAIAIGLLIPATHHAVQG
jgi:hypothetical protein